MKLTPPAACRLVHAFLAGWCLLAGVGAARAQITFTNVADTTMAAPDGSGNFYGFGQYSLSAGRVAFTSGPLYLATIGTTDISLVVSDRSGLAEVSSPSSPVIGGNIIAYEYTYQYGPSSVPESNALVLDLSAAAGTGRYGLTNGFVFPAISGQTVAYEETDYPPTSYPPIPPYPAPTSYEVYTFTLGTNGGANVSNTIADTTTTVVPEGGGNFTSLGEEVSISGNIVAFVGSYSGGTGIYTGTVGGTGVSPVVDLTTAAPGESGNFTSLGTPYISGNTLVFLGGYGISGEGIFTATVGSVGANLVADRTTLVPGHKELPFNSYTQVLISGNNIVFGGTHNEGSGLFAATGGTMIEVLGTGDALFGSTVTTLDMYFFSVDGNEIAFSYTLANGVSGIAVANIGPGPAITSATIVSAQAGQPFTYQITASNAPTGYTVTGLPDGLTFDPSTGLISGTPTQGGASSVGLSATNASGTGTATLTLTVAAAPLPTVTLAAIGDVEAVEGSEVGKAFVSRTGDTTAALTVRYKVVGSARSGVDYKSVTDLAVIPAGTNRVKVKIKPIDDHVREGTRVAKIKLLPSPDGSYTLGATTVAKVRIIDND